MSIFGFLFKTKKKKTDAGANKQRLSSRLAMSEPIRLRLLDGGEGPAILQDVSAGGACLRTHQRLRVGEQLGLSMYFGHDQRYELSGRVVYARPGHQGFHARYGVSFVHMSEEEHFRLDSFVADRVAEGHFGVRTFPAPNAPNFQRP